MNAVRHSMPRFYVLLIALALSPLSALCQQTGNPDNQNTMEGTVVSSSRETLVVRTEDGEFQLFVFDRYTTRPRALANGSRVRVVSVPSDEAGTRLARNITTLEAGSAPQSGTGTTQAAPVPPAVRELESDIKRQARRWRLGVRAGAALDPELILFGVHSQMGPVFHREVLFRPNAEFAFGEVTDLIALNFEAIYRLRGVSRRGTWYPYIGAGPAFTFLHQDFEREQGEGRDIDFGNFEYDTGFNILTGVQFRRGTFFEVKTSIYAQPAPTLRLIFGYNF